MLNSTGLWFIETLLYKTIEPVIEKSFLNSFDSKILLVGGKKHMEIIQTFKKYWLVISYKEEASPFLNGYFA